VAGTNAIGAMAVGCPRAGLAALLAFKRLSGTGDGLLAFVEARSSFDEGGMLMLFPRKSNGPDWCRSGLSENPSSLKAHIFYPD
jgi:hypothetical protein